MAKYYINNQQSKQIEYMGNKGIDKSNDQFLKVVNEMKRQSNQYPVQKVSTHPQERYKSHMAQTLRKQQMSKEIKRVLIDAVENKLKKQDLTATVSVLKSLRSNNPEQLLKSSLAMSKKFGETKNVVVKFDRKLKTIKKTIAQKQSLNQFIPYREEDTIEGRIKYTGSFISKQLNKPYHPFKLLCKRFSDLLAVYLQQQTNSKIQQEYQAKEDLQQKTIKSFCHYMAAGCLGIYKKWIIEYTGLQEKKYDKWIHSLVLNQIWSVNDNYMLNMMLAIIEKTRVKLKIDIQSLNTCSSMGMLHPRLFAIDEPFQIQGHYFTAIFQMSLLTEQKKPAQMLKQLENIKSSICEDIDNYHKLCEKGQIYQINGDNIMGIVAYVLTKISTKIQQISTVLLFLKMLYGEGIYYNMDTSSYMYSTIWGAIEYLESKNFSTQPNQIEKEEQGKTKKNVESFATNNTTNNV